jgi:hypothetical protein
MQLQLQGASHDAGCCTLLQQHSLANMLLIGIAFLVFARMPLHACDLKLHSLFTDQRAPLPLGQQRRCTSPHAYQRAATMHTA